MYSVYILYSFNIDRFYVGFTHDLDRRISEHNRRKGKFTDRGIPWQIVYTEDYATRDEAAKRESFIKSRKSRQFILDLISSPSL